MRWPSKANKDTSSEVRLLGKLDDGVSLTRREKKQVAKILSNQERTFKAAEEAGVIPPLVAEYLQASVENERRKLRDNLSPSEGSRGSYEPPVT